MTLFGFVVALTAFAFIAGVVATDALPRWTAVPAAIALILNVIGTLGVFSETGPLSIEGMFTVFVPFVSTMVWHVGTSIAILRRPEPASNMSM